MLRRVLLCSTLILFAPTITMAATIVSQTTSFLGIFSGTFAAQWTQADTWNNVSVSADFGSNSGPGGSSITWFLNHNGTAIGDQVATGVTPIPAGISTQVPFSGLTLVPGTYFLTFDPADAVSGMVGGSSPTNFAAPGVTLNGVFTLGSAAYPPQGAPTPAPGAIRFIVTGDLAPPAEADLSLVKTPTTAASVPPGSNVVFALTATNNGPGNASGVTVTDTLPAGLAYVANDCGATFASPTLTWNIGGLAASTAATCNLTVTVTQAGAIVNSASVSAAETDPVPSNNIGQATVTGLSVVAIPTIDPAGLTALVALLALAAALVMRRGHGA